MLGMQTLNNIVASLVTGFGQIEKASKPLSVLVPILGNLTNAVKGLSGAGGFADVLTQIANIVDMFDPAAVNQFMIVIEDLMAVVGSILQPILVEGTKILRQFADHLATAVPAFKPLVDVVIEIMHIFAGLMMPFFKMLVPMLQLITGILKSLLPLIQLYADVLKMVAEVVTLGINLMIKAYNAAVANWVGRNLFGAEKIKEMSFEGLTQKSSFGMAVKKTGSMGGEELGRQMRQAAMQAPVDWPKTMSVIHVKQQEANTTLGKIADGVLRIQAGILSFGVSELLR